MNTIPVQQAAPGTKKTNKIVIIGLILALILCCLCVLVGGVAAYLYFYGTPGITSEIFSNIPPLADNNPEGNTEPLEESNETIPEPGAAPEKSPIQLPNLFGVKMGDEVRCEPCGFTYKKVPDYVFDDSWGIQSMSAPGADSFTGPNISLAASVPEVEITQEELIDKLSNKSNEWTYSNQRTIRVDGVNGVSFDIEGTENGIAIKGQILGARVNAKQLFVISGVAPADKWEEIRPYFDGVLNSISFFTPVPLPTSTDQP